MKEEVDDGTEDLTSSECHQLLEEGGVGILALCGVEAPILRPVNFALHEGKVVIRTGEGQILQAAQGEEPASFVVSKIDRFEHTGSSVIVSGVLLEQSSLGSISNLRVRPWANAEKHRFVALSIEDLSGRRIAKGGSPR